MIGASQRIAFDLAKRQLGAAMRAAFGHHMRRAVFGTIEREILAEDMNRLGVARRDVRAAIDRLPERAKVAPGERARPGAQ